MLSSLAEISSELGFISFGLCRPGIPFFFEAYERYLSRGYYGEMEYLNLRYEQRKDPELLLPGLKTILCFAYPYPSYKLTTKEGLTVARFSNPFLADYHWLIKKKLRTIVESLRPRYPQARFRIFVDSGPVLERSLAYKAGIGFFGKNTSLIIPGYGSFFFLGEIFTTADLPFEEPTPLESTCSDCDLCTKACPQGAIVEPYVMDARKCLSYLTIEYEGKFEGLIKGKEITSFYGCDICQEVCPHNPVSKSIKALPHKAYFEGLTLEDFQRIFGHSALSRGGLLKIKRNLNTLSQFKS